jgi:phage N-6-adenine-methyltransferase
MELEFHPLANIFPLIEGAEFHALVEDIRLNGQREPIVLLDGKILDGRNRYRACLLAGEEPASVTYYGEDAVSFVISLNLRRRHLDETQRAVVAAKLANIKREDTLNKGPRSANLQNGISQSDAADMLNVSTRSVSSARKVIDEGVPKLVEALERGEIAVSAAAEIASLPQEYQQEIITSGSEAVKEAAAEIRHYRTQFTGNNEWYTPTKYVELARQLFGGKIDIDPASNELAQGVVQATEYYTKEMDGLNKDWTGNVWLNPPYSQPEIVNFTDKLVDEIDKGNAKSAILLTHNSTDTAWFQKVAQKATAICFTRGRIKFYSPENQSAAPTMGQAFCYFGHDISAFTRLFGDVGFVVQVVG